MHCPTLSEFPPPPAGKTGWPWTEESEPLPDTMPNPSTSSGQVAFSWPRMSIVTPSYNQGQFIEETIRSVLLQGYPNLEYIIVDGGSTDGSVEVIRKYEPWLAHWVSEPDDGQAAAINKGWRRATGEIVAWLNSDDCYEPGAVHAAATYLDEHSEVAAVYGRCAFVDEHGRALAGGKPSGEQAVDLERWLTTWITPIPQPSTFVRRSVLDEIGFLDETLQFCMDTDLWIRIALVAVFGNIPACLSRFRYHPASKSSRLYRLNGQEMLAIARKTVDSPDWPTSLRATRNQVLSAAHLRCARRYRKGGLWRDALRAVWRGLLLYPRHLDRDLFNFLLRIIGDDLVLRRVSGMRAGLRRAIRGR